jgi:hypothetical protein
MVQNLLEADGKGIGWIGPIKIWSQVTGGSPGPTSRFSHPLARYGWIPEKGLLHDICRETPTEPAKPGRQPPVAHGTIGKEFLCIAVFVPDPLTVGVQLFDKVDIPALSLGLFMKIDKVNQIVQCFDPSDEPPLGIALQRHGQTNQANQVYGKS